jgi:hypothetical protein
MCVCGRLVTHYSLEELETVTECICSCGNPDLSTTWEWCANPI